MAALHELSLAARYCDLLIMLDKRRIVATGSPRDVLTWSRISRV